MKKIIFILLLIAASFGSSFAFKAALSRSERQEAGLKRVTGIGGIFFKCKEPAKVRAWYREHLGLQTNQYGAVFEWRQGADTLKKGFTQWRALKKSFRIYGVENLVFLPRFLYLKLSKERH